MQAGKADLVGGDLMHYYQHHIGDFIKDTANLNDHQLATYLRMLWSYYDTEAPITGDIDDVAFAMRSDEKTVRLLLRHYFNEQDDGWHHARCDRELNEYREKSEKARSSASARWKNANALQTQSKRKANDSLSDANQEPRTNNQEPYKEKSERKRPPSFDASTIELPDWLDKDTWASWCEDRKKRGKPVTEKAAQLQIKQLAAYMQEGHTPQSVIEYSIAGTYQGLFAPKRSAPQSNRPDSRHNGFELKDYTAGVNDDGSFQ